MNTMFDTLQDLLDRLGGVPASRVLIWPAPGKATVADVIRHIDGGYAVGDTLVTRVLPGVTLSLAKLFEKLGPPEGRKPPKSGKK